jgi:hypothetical protein
MVALSSSLQNVEALHDPALASWEFYPLLSFRARSEFCSRRGPHSMTVSMYKVSVPIFVQFLTAQSKCIDKAVAHIEAKQLDPNFFLNMRLFPDMYPYVRQVQQASTHAARCCSALAGTEMPNMPNTEASFAELKARLAKTIDYCKTFKPAQIDGTGTRTSLSSSAPTSASSRGRGCCKISSCRTSISTAPRRMTSCAIAGSSSASAIS